MKNKLFTYLRAASIMLALCAMTLQANALGQKELQQLLDSPANVQNRASGDEIREIDLTEFTEPITTTLFVRNQSVRFINGTLRLAESFDGPLIQILNGYTLELASTASFVGNLSVGSHESSPLVDVQNGLFRIRGGVVDAYPSASSNRAIPYEHFLSEKNVIGLTGGSNSSFEMSYGKVNGHLTINAETKAEIYGGHVNQVSAAADFTLSGETEVDYIFFIEPTACIQLTSELQNTLAIAQYTKEQAILTGAYRQITASLYQTYQVSELDMSHIRLVNSYYSKDRLSLENNTVYVRSGYNIDNITNEDELQKALDAIAAQNPSTPVKVTIAHEGITLTHAIHASANCRATITGGTIHVGGETSGGSALSGSDFMFLIQSNAALYFDNIAIDFHNLTLNMTAFWNNGFLQLNDVEYLNVGMDIVSSWNEFYQNNGQLMIYSGRLPQIKGLVLNNGVYGAATITGATAFVYGHLFANPRIHNTAGATLYFESKLESIWTIEGNWEQYTLEKDFIRGGNMHILDASDYWQMRFAGLPSTVLKRTVYYDGKTRSVKLKTYQSLQDLLDGDDDGETDVPCDGVDIAADLTIEQRLQWLLDGSDCPQHEFEPPFIWMPGGCMFVVTPVLFKDITFDSFSSGHRLYVRNRTEFIDKVVAHNFIWFAIIENGGHLIWHHAETENVQYPIVNNGGTADILAGNLTGTIYNAGTLNLCGCVRLNEIQVHPEGVIRITSPITSQWILDLTFDSTINYPNGLVIMEGADGYELTAADFSQIRFKLPAGCEVRFDSSHNAIVLTNTLGVAGVKMDADSTAPTYSLKGYKVAKPEKGQLYIKNKRKYLMK